MNEFEQAVLEQAIQTFCDTDESDEVVWATERLIRLHHSSAGVLSALIAVSQDRLEKSWVRCRAIDTLGEIGDTKAVLSMIELLDDEDIEVRWTAVKSLELLGDASAIPELERLAQTDDGRFSITPYARANVRKYRTPTVGRSFGFHVCQHARTGVRKAALEAVALLRSGKRARRFFAEDL